MTGHRNRPGLVSAPSTAELFVIRGGRPLTGSIPVNGAKNSALKLLAAALLARGRTVVDNVPAIADVPVMARVLEGVGAQVEVRADRSGFNTTVVVEVDAPGWRPPGRFVARIRASLAVLGPLVGRCGRAWLGLPGGDRIGARQIDLHLRGLTEMGAEVVDHGDAVEVLVADRLRGAEITLDFPSVGATENLLMAAVLARGRTVIDNAAREPEIQDLAAMLTAMGARLEGSGTSTLVVDGVDELQAVRHTCLPDRIEAGTFAFAAAVTGGDVDVVGARSEHLRLPLMKLAAAGALVEEHDTGVRVKGSPDGSVGGLTAVDVVTLPYPGFPTDLQPQLMVLLSQATGISMVTENVFESRFAFVDELVRLGADITVDGHHAVIRGPRQLSGTTVRALDVRAGAACLLAGLVADGETRVIDVSHVDRGYAGIVERLRRLGARIDRLAPTAVSGP